MVLSYLFIIMDDLKWNPHSNPLVSLYFIGHFSNFRHKYVPTLNLYWFFTFFYTNTILFENIQSFRFIITRVLNLLYYSVYVTGLFFKEIMETNNSESRGKTKSNAFCGGKPFDVDAVFLILWYGYIWKINIQCMLPHKDMIEMFVFRFMLLFPLNWNLTNASHTKCETACNIFYLEIIFEREMSKQQKLD